MALRWASGRLLSSPAHHQRSGSHQYSLNHHCPSRQVLSQGLRALRTLCVDTIGINQQDVTEKNFSSR